jgi:hypothetical protein
MASMVEKRAQKEDYITMQVGQIPNLLTGQSKP